MASGQIKMYNGQCDTTLSGSEKSKYSMQYQPSGFRHIKSVQCNTTLSRQQLWTTDTKWVVIRISALGLVFPLPPTMLRLFLVLNPNSRLTFSVNPSLALTFWFVALIWPSWLNQIFIYLFIYVCVCAYFYVFNLYCKRPRLTWVGAR